MPDNSPLPEKFYGNLSEDMALANVFEQITMNQRYGWLLLKYPQREVRLYFQGDLVGLVTPPPECDYIPEKLYYAGKLSEEAYQKVTQSPDAFKTLEEFAAEEDFANLFHNICYDDICSLFTYYEGYFEFIDQNHPEADPSLTPIGSMFECEGILREVAQRQVEWQDICELLPNPEELLICDDPQLSQTAPDDPLGNILRVANYHTVREIILFSYFGKFDTVRVLSSLIRDKRIRPLTESELRSRAAEFALKEDWENAILYYRLLLQKNPKDTESCDVLAQCYEKNNHPENVSQVYFSFAQQLLNSSQKEERSLGGLYLRKFTELNAETPEGIDARVQLLNLVIEQKIDAKGLALKKESANEYKEYSPLLEGKQLCQLLRYRKDDKQKIRQLLENLLKIAPYDRTLQSQYINVCLDMDDITSAVTQYENMAKIYERDHNLPELEAVFQKIIKLVPSRTDISQKLDFLQKQRRQPAKQKGGKKVAVFFFLLVVCGGAGFAYWYFAMQKPVIPKKTVEPVRIGPSTEDIVKQMQEKVDKEVTKLRAEAEKAIQELDLPTAKAKLEIAMRKDATQELKKDIEALWGKVEESWKKFIEQVSRARSLEQSGDFHMARRVYMGLWKEEEFKKIPERNQIRLPYKFDVSPAGASIKVDGKILQKLAADRPVLCWPEFKEIEIYLRGYCSSWYYNSLTSPVETVIEKEDGQKVYPLGDHKVITVKLEKSLLWQVEIGKTSIEGTPCYNNGILYVPLRNGYMDAFQNLNDMAAPAHLWKFQGGRFSDFSTSSPCWYSGVIYIGGNDKVFYGIDANSGQKLGQYKAKNLIHSSPAVSRKHRSVLFGSIDGSIYAMPLLERPVSNWSPIWTYPFKGHVECLPALTEDSVIVGSANGTLLALELKNGTPLWKKVLKNPVTSSPVIDNNTIYVGARNSLYSFDLQGNRLWEFKLGGHINGKPLIRKNNLYVSTDEKIYAVSITQKKEIWFYPTTTTKTSIGPFKSSPTMSSRDILYVGSQKGVMYALSSEGALLWEYNLKSEILSSPVSVANIVVQGADKLYAFLEDT